jgi:hypothetical protein
MNPKRERIETTLVYALSFLYLERMDNLKPTTPKMIKFRDDIIGFLEELNTEVMDNEIVQKGNYFYSLSKKIDTLMRHELKDGI